MDQALILTYYGSKARVKPTIGEDNVTEKTLSFPLVRFATAWIAHGLLKGKRVSETGHMCVPGHLSAIRNKNNTVLQSDTRKIVALIMAQLWSET